MAGRRLRDVTVERATTRLGHFSQASARARRAVNAAAFSGKALVISISEIGLFAFGATAAGVIRDGGEKVFAAAATTAAGTAGV